MSKPKRPHPQLAQLSEDIPAPDLIAENEGTPGMLGALLQEVPVQLELLRQRGEISDEQYLGLIRYFSSEQQKEAALDRLVRLYVDRRRPAHDTRRSVEQSRIVMQYGMVLGPIVPGIGQTIEMRRTVLGDNYVENAELSTQRIADTTSVQISTPEKTVVSACGAPEDDEDHRAVGAALARHHGSRHRIALEEVPGAGARVRDGTLDPQVDVFLKGDSPADDMSIQVVQLKALANELGQHGVAVAAQVDATAVQHTIAHKAAFTDKDKLDLAVYCPVPIGTPTRTSLSETSFDAHGYRRAWLVDATGWVLLLKRSAGT